MTKKNKIRTVPRDSVAEVGYIEGSTGYTKIIYNGEMTIKVNGCKTKNRYLFGNGSVRLVDTGDARCLFDLMPGSFQEVVEVVKKPTKKPLVEKVEDDIQGDYTEDKDKSTEG
jgi:hypothetical protein